LATVAPLYAAIFLFGFSVIPRNEESVAELLYLTDPSLAFRIRKSNKKYFRYHRV
jgi:hypothetical protein